MLMARRAANRGAGCRLGLTRRRQLRVAAIASSFDLRRRRFRMDPVTGTAIRRSCTSRLGKNLGMLTHIELPLLHRMAAAAEPGYFLRTRDTIRRSIAGRFAVLKTWAVANIATQLLRCVRMFQKVLYMLGMAGLAKSVDWLSE
jgi:hypothetical protein